MWLDEPEARRNRSYIYAHAFPSRTFARHRRWLARGLGQPVNGRAPSAGAANLDPTWWSGSTTARAPGVEQDVPNNAAGLVAHLARERRVAGGELNRRGLWRSALSTLPRRRLLVFAPRSSAYGQVGTV
jgi:hypothetical protein